MIAATFNVLSVVFNFHRYPSKTVRRRIRGLKFLSGDKITIPILRKKSNPFFTVLYSFLPDSKHEP
jgi:hypothetical protein